MYITIATSAYVCTSSGCACGRPIVFRTIGGRRIPIHVG
jgi:hypothetical protein